MSVRHPGGSRISGIGPAEGLSSEVVRGTAAPRAVRRRSEAASGNRKLPRAAAGRSGSPGGCRTRLAWHRPGHSEYGAGMRVRSGRWATARYKKGVRMALRAFETDDLERAVGPLSRSRAGGTISSAARCSGSSSIRAAGSTGRFRALGGSPARSWPNARQEAAGGCSRWKVNAPVRSATTASTSPPFRSPPGSCCRGGMTVA